MHDRWWCHPAHFLLSFSFPFKPTVWFFNLCFQIWIWIFFFQESNSFCCYAWWSLAVGKNDFVLHFFPYCHLCFLLFFLPSVTHMAVCKFKIIFWQFVFPFESLETSLLDLHFLLFISPSLTKSFQRPSVSFLSSAHHLRVNHFFALFQHIHHVHPFSPVALFPFLPLLHPNFSSLPQQTLRFFLRVRRWRPRRRLWRGSSPYPLQESFFPPFCFCSHFFSCFPSIHSSSTLLLPSRSQSPPLSHSFLQILLNSQCILHSSPSIPSPPTNKDGTQIILSVHFLFFHLLFFFFFFFSPVFQKLRSSFRHFPFQERQLCELPLSFFFFQEEEKEKCLQQDIIIQEVQKVQISAKDQNGWIQACSVPPDQRKFGLLENSQTSSQKGQAIQTPDLLLLLWKIILTMLFKLVLETSF